MKGQGAQDVERMAFNEDGFRNEYDRWINSSYVNKADKDELSQLSDEDIRARFSAELEFGTAGIRRVMEIGPGSMNLYTVKHITRALGMYLTEHAAGADAKPLSVVIAYDCRNNGEDYAKAAACVLAARGIHVFLFESLRPTPELSFAVRYARAAAGINITASHNTKEYNGYKVYGPDGAQLSPEHADIVAGILAETDVLEEPPLADFDDAVKSGTIELIDGYVDKIYLSKVFEQSHGTVVNDLKIVYTAFHGTGYKFVPEILKHDGFENVICVESQCVPDGDFPTVKSPNPETKESFAMAIELARAEDADLIIGTDPDGDRCGVAIRKANGTTNDTSGDSSDDYLVLTGNQVGVLILDYLINMRKSSLEINADCTPNNNQQSQTSSSVNNSSRPYACKSIVSTNMANRICEMNDIEMVETLTGFKFIGEKMEELSVEQGREFIFGFEESNGYLTGLYARDKDAIVASMLVAEAAAYHKANGRTMEEALNSLYEKYGYYLEEVVSKEFKGPDGGAEMSAFMDDLRKNPPADFGGMPIVRIRDYELGVDGLPKSNVLFYELQGGSSFVVRPSGTEPKIKFYLSAVGTTRADAESKLASLESAI